MVTLYDITLNRLTLIMCLAIPGKVKKIDGRKVLVQYPNEERTVLNGDTKIEIGDYALVQMGVIIQKISEKDALNSWKAWQNAGK